MIFNYRSDTTPLTSQKSEGTLRKTMANEIFSEYPDDYQDYRYDDLTAEDRLRHADCLLNQLVMYNSDHDDGCDDGPDDQKNVEVEDEVEPM